MSSIFTANAVLPLSVESSKLKVCFDSIRSNGPWNRPMNKLPLPSSNTSCLTPLMNVNLGIWDKLTRLIVMLLLLAALLLIALWYLPLIQRNERMRKDNLTLDTEVKKEEETQKRLKSSIDAMRDPRTVERLARERLSYAKTGETVIRFELPATNTVSPALPR